MAFTFRSTTKRGQALRVGQEEVLGGTAESRPQVRPGPGADPGLDAQGCGLPSTWASGFSPQNRNSRGQNGQKNERTLGTGRAVGWGGEQCDPSWVPIPALSLNGCVSWASQVTSRSCNFFSLHEFLGRLNDEKRLACLANHGH